VATNNRGMASQVPNIASGGGVIAADSEATNDALAQRDASGNIKYNILRALLGIRTAGHTYIDQQNKTASFSVDESSNNGTIYRCDATSGAITVTLPAASVSTDKVVIVKKTDATTSAVTVDGNSTETIDGLTTFVLYTQGDAVAIVCDGSNWHVIGDYRRDPTIAKSALFTAESQRIDITYLVTNATAFSATLPTAASMNGVKLTFIKVDAAAEILTIQAAGAETINGANTYTVINAQYERVVIQSNGTAWFIVSV
jgi:hypothetical protein